MYTEILRAFDGTSAPFMYAITFLLAYAITIVVERIYCYYILWPNLGVVQRIEMSNLKDLQVHLKKHPLSSFLNDIQEDMSSDLYWKKVQQHAPLIELAIKKRLSILANLANIATMLGLLGTVYGLVYALGGLEQASTIERTARLSEGISAAMITTAWGLVVGVPSLFAHGFLSSRASEIIAFCESFCVSLSPVAATTNTSTNDVLVGQDS